ncbi:hypothetical protein SLS62_002397 [Diatrype stigma]|uniref:Kelch repeat-containing protein n=1 Tax=Diatrype stigma TaxID=117547 RepID=A0AAN9V8J4_9PEZI
MESGIPKGRKSIFKEEGLGVSERNVQPRRASTGLEQETEAREFIEIEAAAADAPESTSERAQTQKKRRRSEGQQDESKNGGGVGVTRWLSKLAKGEKRPKIKLTASATPPPSSVAGLSRAAVIALLIAVVLPSFSYSNGRQTVPVGGAEAALIRTRTPGNTHLPRQDSPTDVCARWAGQSAILNGTMYIYGGRSKTSQDQTTDTWNNDFLTLDLTQSWDISAPLLSGLPQPDGPPAVSLGYLWNDYHRLFLYGGEFSDSPPATPAPPSTWQYDIASSTWTEFASPKTSAGNYSAPADQPVQRAAEGAGLSVPELGVSWYFGGHLDAYTTPGWSAQDVPRVYLRSLLEFTHPGYGNSGVDDLRGAGAPQAGGAYRNITQGGIQDSAGFLERADGLLVYVPGWGPRGVLLGLGGGSVGDHETTDAYASMTTIDVYDIETSEWYHQETRGSDAAPQVRVNPCAVVFSAPDASSFNVYMYGGQNLLPYGEQTQYADVWILTVPSFTWVRVDPASLEEGDASPPAARAGHHCAPRDGQMVVVGGYTGANATCDDPGVYAFDASRLRWSSGFTAAAAGAGDADRAPDADADNSVLAGSYGYRVPDAVQSVVGGSSDGGATATTPAAGPATGGPFATGQPPVFTVTAAASTATVTGGGGSSGDPAVGGGGGGRSNAGGQIAAGVIAGLAGLAAVYLGFCAWLYRRQVGAYKRHMAVANRYNNANYDNGDQAEKRGGSGGNGSGDEKSLLAGAAGAGIIREKLRKVQPAPLLLPHNRGGGSGDTGSNGAMSPTAAAATAGAGGQFGWVGQQGLLAADPPWMAMLGGGAGGRRSEDASLGSVGAAGGSSSGAGSAGAASLHQQQQQQGGLPRPSEDRSPWGYDGYSPGGGAGIGRNKSDASGSSGDESVEGLIDGREPSFFSVVLGPRRALRVVNGMEMENEP